jgi:stringent starvation protein B
VPIECVSAVYARENGHGMAFDVPKPLALTPEEAALQTIKASGKKPTLKSVPDSAGVSPLSLVDASVESKAIEDQGKSEANDSVEVPEPTPPPTNGGPPKLKRVK